jgi:hypothetical protein
MTGGGCIFAVILTAIIMGLFTWYVFTAKPAAHKQMSAIEWDSGVSRSAAA